MITYAILGYIVVGYVFSLAVMRKQRWPCRFPRIFTISVFAACWPVTLAGWLRDRSK